MAEDRVVEFSEGVSVSAPDDSQPLAVSYIIATEQTTPSTPATGKQAIYPKSDGSWYQLDDTGTEQSLGGGGGGGALNFDTKGTAESMTTDDFSTGNNATFDGGGTIAGTLSISTTAGDLIRGSKVIKYVGSATAGDNTDDYVARDPIDIPQGYRGRFIGLKWQYRTANYTSGNICAKIKDTTNGTILLDDTHTLDAYADATDNTGAEFVTNFYCPSDCAQIEWGFIVLTGEASMTLVIDDVEISPDPFLIADFDNISDWESVTLTGSLSTNATYSGRKRRVADTLEVEGRISFSGVNTEGAVTITIPDSLVINTSILADGSSDNKTLGIAVFEDTGGQDLFGVVGYNNTTSVAIFASEDDHGVGAAYVGIGTAADTSSNVPLTIANGDKIIFKFSVPITGWTSKTEHIVTPTQMSLPSKCSGADTTAIADATVTYIGFGTTDFDVDGNFTGVGNSNSTSSTGATYWTAPRDMHIRVRALVQSDDADLDAGEPFRLLIRKNGSTVTQIYQEVQGSLGTPFVSRQVNDIYKVDKDDQIAIAVYMDDTGSNTWALNGGTDAGHFSVEQIDITPVLGAIPTANECIRYNTVAGLGSTATKIPYYTNEELNRVPEGTMTGANDSTNGCSVTVNKDGVYAACMTHNLTTASYWGISVNGTVTTNFTGHSATICKATNYQDSSDTIDNVSITMFLNAGDIIRPHTNGTAVGTLGAFSNFSVTKLL